MRWLFVVVLVALFELFSYGAAQGLRWGLASILTPQSGQYLLWGLLAISNSLLLVAILRIFSQGLKVAMTWLTLLWLVMLTTLAVALVNLIIASGLDSFYQQPFYQHYGVLFLTLLGFIGLVSLSIYNAYTPVVRRLRITTNKLLTTPLRIGMVSDLHLGLLVGNHHLDRLIDIVQREKIQLLLMPGDIMDDDIKHYQANQMQAKVQALVAQLPLGAYATLGNHDLYGDRVQITETLRQSGVHVLVDEAVLVDDQVWLAGRLDDMVGNRKATAELMPTNSNKPILLMDHRPSEIDANTQLAIDLQVSGHTHNGQIFPANFIVKYLNTVAYGYKKIRNTHVVVSSGFGFWGVPFRLGSQSEVWVIELVGQSAS
ncbi:MAG: metallophosphoesterase [Moraxellaceae bacterium]|nr:MAG: metallophosphoesterase [Moraxellaceae bacterium]